jgi:hypothetical protein
MCTGMFQARSSSKFQPLPTMSVSIGKAAPAAPREPAVQVPVEEVVDPVTAIPAQQQEVIQAVPRRRRASRAEAKPTPGISRTEDTHEAPGPAETAGAAKSLPPEKVRSKTKDHVFDDQPVRAGRRLRIRQPPPPRWTTAGKARRGRLK